MYHIHKLKPDFNITWAVLPPGIIVILFAFAAIFIGIQAGLLVLFLSFILYAVFTVTVYFRTRNYTFLASTLMQLCFAFFFATVPEGIFPFPDKKMAWFLYFCAIIIGIWIIILTITKKAKWKGREIFELASQPVEMSVNGFTNRPRPSGKAEYTRHELTGFAEFLRRNLIAMPFAEDNRVVLVPVKMGDEFSFIFNPKKFRTERSWIAFDFRGNITVSISKKDYLDYREEFSFDQLCENLGRLFIGFLEYYKKDEADRIIYKLNEADYGFLS